MTFNLDSVNNKVIHCTNQFQTDILADDWNQTSTYYGGYTLNTGGTPNATIQTGLTYGASLVTDGRALRRVWDIAIGKYERVRYRIEIFSDTDHNDPDVKYGIQVPASSTVNQYRRQIGSVPIAGGGGTDVIIDFVEDTVVNEASSGYTPNGTWVSLNGSTAATMVGSAGPSILLFDGVVEASSTAGKLGFYFGQSTSSAQASRVKAGSTFQYLRF
tara:strand:- start:710 stop:1357 length:648 start_codon:yes stop_codon:yes gene_type:complete